MARLEPRLPPPEVEPAIYDESYYRTACAGHPEWVSSGGAQASAIYAGSLARAGDVTGATVVDLGTGRGELLAVAIERGAARAIGVEYSPAALALARQTLAAHAVEDRATVVEADARAIPLGDAVADIVTLLDVVEHLAPAELEATLGEAHRLLRPGGRLLAHTMPNRLIYSVTYRTQRALSPSRRRRWAADPRNELERRMHVNEQSVGSLRRALRNADFDRVEVTLGRWVYADFVPSERARLTYRRLAQAPGLRRFGIGDIWAEARRP